jgi:hypothetical protein
MSWNRLGRERCRESRDGATSLREPMVHRGSYSEVWIQDPRRVGNHFGSTKEPFLAATMLEVKAEPDAGQEPSHESLLSPSGAMADYCRLIHGDSAGALLLCGLKTGAESR